MQPSFRDCLVIQPGVAFDCAKTVFHVPHGNCGRRALRFTDFGRCDIRSRRDLALGPGDFALELLRICRTGVVPLFWLPDALLLCPVLPYTARRSRHHPRPERVPPRQLHPGGWGSGGAGTRGIFHRRSNLWETASDRPSEDIAPG
jgi:hypothetical protein